MENLFLSANIILPFLLIMGLGLLLRKTHVLDEPAARKLNRVVFSAGIPTLCFSSLYNADLASLSDRRILAFMAGGIALVYAACFLIVPRLERDNRRRGVLIQGIFRPNDALFGIPVAMALLGEGHVALMALTVSMTVILFNTLGVIALETYREGGGSFKRVLLEIVKHPIIWGCVLGLAANLTGLRLPAFFLKAVTHLSNFAAPASFLSLGATLSFETMRSNRVPLWTASLCKLLLVPAVIVTLAILMGFRGEMLIIALVIFGAPTAIATYPMAEAAGADAELAGEIVALTAALSMFTMFLFIFILLQLGVI